MEETEIKNKRKPQKRAAHIMSRLFVGNVQIHKVMIGNKEIKEVYVGSTHVFSKS